MEVLGIDRQAQSDLVTRALKDKNIGGKPPTENHKQMARLMCVPQGGEDKQIELLPEGAYTVLKLDITKNPSDFFNNNAIILNSPVDLMGRPVLVGADAVDGTFLLRSKQVTDDIGKLMAPVIGSSAKKEEATQELAKLLKEGKVEQIMLGDVVNTAIVTSTEDALKRGKKDVETGLNTEDRLRVLKLFFTPIKVDSDFQYTVEGARGYNVFTRTLKELDDQINSIRERQNGESDPMIKHVIRIQLEIIEKFREKRVEWEEKLKVGTEWQKYLNDKRGVMNRSDVKFDVRKDVIREFSNRLSEESEGIKQYANSGEKIDIKLLENNVINRTVDMALLSYMQNAKFDVGLKPIRD